MKVLAVVAAFLLPQAVAAEPGRYEAILFEVSMVSIDTQTGAVDACVVDPERGPYCQVMVEAADPENTVPNRFHLFIKARNGKVEGLWIFDSSYGRARYCPKAGSPPLKCVGADKQ